MINCLHPDVSKNLRLIGKWGCGGSSGHRECKQKFTDEDSSNASVSLTSFVPLQILGSDNLNKQLFILKNPRRSSPRYCRPIGIQFFKETVSLTGQEQQHVANQIEFLIPFTLIIDGKEVTVKFELFFTTLRKNNIRIKEYFFDSNKWLSWMVTNKYFFRSKKYFYCL